MGLARSTGSGWYDGSDWLLRFQPAGFTGFVFLADLSPRVVVPGSNNFSVVALDSFDGSAFGFSITLCLKGLLAYPSEFVANAIDLSLIFVKGSFSLVTISFSISFLSGTISVGVCFLLDLGH
jgi:hypothetical protein